MAQNTYPWPSTGSVGVGTTSPDYLFTVKGISHLGSDLILTRTDNNNTASIVVDNVVTKSLYLQKLGGGNIDVINLLGTSIGLNGNTTIGGTAVGQGASKVTIYTNTSGDGVFLSNDGSGYGGSSGFIKMHGPSLPAGGWNSITQSGDAGIIYGTTGLTANLGFVIAPVSTGSACGLRIDKSGNVGIGTADTKTYQLAVNGSAIFTKAVVKLYTNWPDYVFKKEYRLPSLDSVAQFIETNHHLSDIPSADSVAKNGIDLGSNQAALLKKIEELTLYAIGQQQQLEELRKANKKMEARLNELEVTLKK